MMLGELPSEDAPVSVLEAPEVCNTPMLGGHRCEKPRGHADGVHAWGSFQVTRQVKARARQHVPGQMNKTEARYAEHLELARRAGVVLEWRFEQFTLKLGPDLRYTPDFFVLLPDAFIEFHEVKGPKKHKVTGTQTYRAEEDALVKIRSAAQQLPWFTFRLCWWDKDLVGWAVKEIG